MSALTDSFENKLLDWMLRGQALGLANSSAGAGSGPTSTYVGLITAAGSDASVGTEVSGGSYARVQVASSLANWAGTQGAGTTVASSGSSGTTSNNNAITFPAPSAAWGQVVEFGVFDSATGGTELFRGTLGSAKTINNGDPAPYFPAGSLTFQIDN
jgi:hypothetical protein